MLRLLCPQWVFDNYEAVTPEFLKEHGVKLLLADLDFTLAPKSQSEPDESLTRWIGALKEAGIEFAILSNNRSPVRVEKFCKPLKVGYVGHAGKPGTRGFHEAMARYGVNRYFVNLRIAMISSGIQEEIVMATITAGEFRNGKVFEMEGKYYQVVEFQHVKPGKGAAFVRTKMKNVVTGGVTETSFNPTAKFEEVAIERKNMEYSYNDGDLYYFMDQETYDMVPLNRDMLGDAFRFVKENTMCMILSIKGNVFGVEPPNFVDLEVTETEPGLAGNTATNTLKPATLETGAEIKVPLFINIGDKIQIDTRTGEYIGRAK